MESGSSSRPPIARSRAGVGSAANGAERTPVLSAAPNTVWQSRTYQYPVVKTGLRRFGGAAPRRMLLRS